MCQADVQHVHNLLGGCHVAPETFQVSLVQLRAEDLRSSDGAGALRAA